jgi:hypothetical protein
MIIGISGKMQSGKDTVGKILQYLIDNNEYGHICEFKEYDLSKSNWQIKKFAGKVKEICSILTGCTKEQLEDETFKNSKLLNEWIRYGYADGFKRIHKDGVKTTVMINKQCDKERYESELKANWQTTYKHHITYRELIQYVGTDLFRNKFHNDTWVNALFADYKPIKFYHGESVEKGIYDVTEEDELQAEIYPEYPNWIITDVRFPNELEAIKDREGITIRINRNMLGNLTSKGKFNYKIPNDNHESETALDNTEFDYTIDNNGTIDDLIIKVKEILIKEKII